MSMGMLPLKKNLYDLFMYDKLFIKSVLNFYNLFAKLHLCNIQILWIFIYYIVGVILEV